ncbi:hypothetical protein KXD40_000788 [Peronospora effusa]|nr:hypothetical protein KXD40_000788 [Peronospora effusa]CAI5705748.1 unnamed protein product [Peronospora effusa]
MEITKTTRFLTQFSRAVFQQWTQTATHDQFWKDKTFVHVMVEDAVAKLPHGKLQTELLRNLKPLETQLIALLHDLHVNYVQEEEKKKTEKESWTCGALLNEELTELELTRAATATSTDKQRRVTGVLALDDGLDRVHHLDTDVENVDELVHLFGLIAARNYETLHEQEHKRGLVLERLAVCAQNLVEKWCIVSGNWSCGEEEDVVKQVQKLRELLERVVVQDAVALARVSDCNGSLKAPWTMFYRPEERKEWKKVSYDKEMAKIYGVLLTLAVYFPIENDEEEETSDESLSSGDEEEESRQERKKLKQISPLAQAQLTTRQVLLAAQMRQRGLDQNNQWLVLVLSFLQSLHKPTTYLDEDGDEALDYQSRCELLDCVGGLYTRAFASAALFNQAKESTTEEKTAMQDRGLFEAIVCLRHAAHFMRVERKSSLPVITTAMAQLAGVPLPASFVSWLDHEQTADPKSVLEKAIQRLWKKCIGQNRMANILLSSTDVSDEEMPLIQRNYLEHLDQLAIANANKTNRQDDTTSAESAEALVVNTDSLFYVDNAGGEDKEKTNKTKKKRANKKKKRTNKTIDVSPAKRSRASSS